ncbi:transporter substrate-binding domain-containing protein [Terasakiella sp. A23]|uniref:substrate-binding periplasmic protein n=1 Tax=Terasakiella sp. FCG-A23 TaxID=3080561 RepID=UPI0029540612|nr:transporter substrate-binding domain-containing protein [Terasakiella sp. A23]MDV7339708.1 transporter substrate-binding domain-containing protein [Terasakiella sp. A23]
MKYIVSTLTLFFLGFVNPAQADQPYGGTEISVVYANQWAPISYEEGGEIKGLLPDRMDEILAQQMGMKVTHIPSPWGRAQKLVERGSVDAFVTTVTPKRLQYSSASEAKVFILPFVPVVRSFDLKVKSFKDADDLSQYKDQLFCDVLGNGWADYFYKDKPVQVYTAPTIKECLLLLRAGRVQSIIHAEPVLRKYIKELDLEKALTVLPRPSARSPKFSLMISKKSRLDQDFLDYFDQHLASQKEIEN